jgi:hypothetical protein
VCDLQQYREGRAGVFGKWDDGLFALSILSTEHRSEDRARESKGTAVDLESFDTTGMLITDYEGEVMLRIELDRFDVGEAFISSFRVLNRPWSVLGGCSSRLPSDFPAIVGKGARRMGVTAGAV